MSLARHPDKVKQKATIENLSISDDMLRLVNQRFDWIQKAKTVLENVETKVMWDWHIRRSRGMYKFLANKILQLTLYYQQAKHALQERIAEDRDKAAKNFVPRPTTSEPMTLTPQTFTTLAGEPVKVKPVPKSYLRRSSSSSGYEPNSQYERETADDVGPESEPARPSMVSSPARPEMVSCP